MKNGGKNKSVAFIILFSVCWNHEKNNDNFNSFFSAVYDSL